MDQSKRTRKGSGGLHSYSHGCIYFASGIGNMGLGVSVDTTCQAGQISGTGSSLPRAPPEGNLNSELAVESRCNCTGIWNPEHASIPANKLASAWLEMEGKPPNFFPGKKEKVKQTFLRAPTLRLVI